MQALVPIFCICIFIVLILDLFSCFLPRSRESPEPEEETRKAASRRLLGASEVAGGLAFLAFARSHCFLYGRMSSRRPSTSRQSVVP